ncbi:MAG: pirin family protein [Oscillatoriales cyanobacterium RM2_1_1]|nr:pirin family protein [Oscillatoriales cyanobacterium SM2_3_0]NJO45973.1 pirin family protein [Oscillatoriales cyanobacterium RM2_1_1]
MLTLRKSTDRGHANHGWLDTYHTFSFAHYYNPDQMGFRALRVINEDRVSPSRGFGTHGHRDMEIITYVLDGALEHQDSLGSGAIIHRGEVQRITAGTGIQHSEFNPSPQEPVHLLQIWLLPQASGLTPSYEQKAFNVLTHPGQFHLIASPDGRANSLTVHQDVALSAAVLQPGDQLSYRFTPQRHGWLQVAQGEVELADNTLTAGDGMAISDRPEIFLKAHKASELLLFDLV